MSHPSDVARSLTISPCAEPQLPGVVPPSAEEIAEAVQAVLGWVCIRRLAAHLGLLPDDLEEVRQSAVVNALQARRRFDPQRSLHSWLVWIVRNLMYDVVRRRYRRRTRPLLNEDGRLVIDPPAHTPEPIEELVAAETAARVRAALAEANPTVQRIAELRLAGCSNVEIAERLGLSASTVGTMWHRFKARLAN